MPEPILVATADGSLHLVESDGSLRWSSSIGAMVTSYQAPGGDGSALGSVNVGDSGGGGGGGGGPGGVGSGLATGASSPATMVRAEH